MNSEIDALPSLDTKLLWWRDSQCRFIGLFVVVICISTIAATVFFKKHELQQLREEKLGTLTQLAGVFSEHVVGTFNLADQTLRYVRRDYLTVSRERFNKSIQDNAQTLSRLFKQISIADEQGRVTATSIKTPAAELAKVNISDRPHFQFHLREQDDITRIGPPLVGRVSKQASIQVTRRISDAQNRFKGIIVTSLAPEYFQNFFKQITTAGQSEISVGLVGYDGIIRARADKNAIDYGQDISSRTEFQTAIKEPLKSFQMTSLSGGAPALYVFKRIDEYRLAVFVSMPLEEINKEFDANFLLPRALAASMLIFAALAGFLLIRLRIRELAYIAKLQEREKSLIKANAFQSRMISSVSHELRTPLSSILGYASIIAKDDPDPDMKSFAGIIEDAAEHLKRVIDGVLDLSKKEAGHLEVVRARVNVRQLAERCVQLFVVGANAKGVALTSRVDSGVSEFIYSDATKLIQIIENLLSNALKNTIAGSVELHIRTVQSGNSIEFSVSDTGVGIGPENIKDLFKMFHRIKDDYHDGLPGSGIGLNIVKEFTELLGGHVAVESEPGKGSKFRIVLPLIAES